jgi:hypothetical protein
MSIFLENMIYYKNQMGGACSSVRRGERRVQGFGRKT